MELRKMPRIPGYGWGKPLFVGVSAENYAEEWLLSLTRGGAWGARNAVGFVGLILHEDHVYFRSLRVNKNWRGQGLGRKLLVALLKTYQDVRIEMMPQRFDDGPMDDETLRAWYARYGFRPMLLKPGVCLDPAQKEG